MRGDLRSGWRRPPDPWFRAPRSRNIRCRHTCPARSAQRRAAGAGCLGPAMSVHLAPVRSATGNGFPVSPRRYGLAGRCALCLALLVWCDAAPAKRIGNRLCWLDVPDTWIRSPNNVWMSPARNIEVSVYDNIPFADVFIAVRRRVMGATVFMTRPGVVTVLKQRVGNMTLYLSIAPPGLGAACRAEVRSRTPSGDGEAGRIAALLRRRPS